MDSDVCITDFDSDEDGVEWSCDRSDVDDRSSGDNSMSTVRLQPAGQHVHEFGDFVDNYGWTRCQSKSLPNRQYYYNIHTGCKTWYRPISRYIDMPLISTKESAKSIGQEASDSAGSDLELMSVSDNEKQSKRNKKMPTIEDECDKLIRLSDVIARYYNSSQRELVLNQQGTKLNLMNAAYSDRQNCNDTNDEDNNNNDPIDSSKSGCSPFHVASFLESDFFVEENEEVNTETTLQISKRKNNDNASVDSFSSSTTSSQDVAPRRVAYRVPRLKKITVKDQLIRQKPYCPRVKVEAGPTKIVCEMYGVRTINYNLPPSTVEESVRLQVNVKTTTLSESDTESASSQPSPTKIKQLCDSDWLDAIGLRKPTLSSSNSSLTTSDTSSNSSHTSSSTASTCSTCTSCPTCTSCQ